MPRKELKEPRQVEQWLATWGQILHAQNKTGELILIGSAALLWHAHQNNITTGLSENSMDADPITNDECVAELGYAAGIGSEFEAINGWHINLMPQQTLSEFHPEWKSHQSTKQYGTLKVRVPCVVHLLLPKIKRGEPRDMRHYQWVRNVGLLDGVSPETLSLLDEAISRQSVSEKSE